MASTSTESTEAPPTTKSSSAAPSPHRTKTTLCQFYLQGDCKNGTNCTFAHGTKELRAPGSSSSESQGESQGSKYKTSLCTSFLSYGTCNYGDGCCYAHGIFELRPAGGWDNSAMAAGNPLFKTIICKNYIETGWCQFGDQCRYAHGKKDMRPKPDKFVMDTNELSDEMKAKMKAKALSTPGYKSKLCQTFEETGQCQYGDICIFAHGEGEKRNVEADPAKPKPPGFKSAMCKNIKDSGECRYGDNCMFAHSEDELAVGVQKSPHFKTTMCKNFSEMGECEFGDSCNFAHGRGELRPKPNIPMSPNGRFPGGAGRGGFLRPPSGFPRAPGGYPGSSGGGFPGPSSQGFNQGYKTKMCQNTIAGVRCPRAAQCDFAHSPMELRTKNGPSPRFSPPNNFGGQGRFGGGFAGGRPSFPPSGPGGPPMAKTKMCNNIQQSGFCPRGPSCNFAHDPSELGGGGGVVPPPNVFKTKMCSMLLNGHCPRGDSCSFAHDPSELRTMKNGGGPQTLSPAPGKPTFKTRLCENWKQNRYCEREETCAFAHGPQEQERALSEYKNNQIATNPRYKTSRCQQYGQYGYCDKGDTCHFAHSEADLRRVKKTAMCRNIMFGTACPHGDECHFAHNRWELEGYGDGDNGGGRGGYSGGPGGYSNALKRKPEHAKTQLCQNYMGSGYCKFGDNCNFAHESISPFKRMKRGTIN